MRTFRRGSGARCKLRVTPNAMSIAPSASRPARVLVVVDEVLCIKIAQRTLQRAGFDVVTATNGVAALEVLETETVDLALVDVTMAPIDGYELCERFRKRSAELPVIMVSAFAEDEFRERARAAGASDVLGKPFSWSTLLERVRALLKSGGFAP
jgi:DNA-binding response OmpR family regulator